MSSNNDDDAKGSSPLTSSSQKNIVGGNNDNVVLPDAFPRRYIFNDVDMDHFNRSKAKQELLKFTQVCGRACTASSSYMPDRPWSGLSLGTAALLGSLQAMQDYHVAINAQDLNFQSQATGVRFGNPVFRKWHAKLVEHCVSIIHTVLSEASKSPTNNASSNNNETGNSNEASNIDSDDHVSEEDLFKAVERGRKAANTVVTMNEIAAESENNATNTLCHGRIVQELSAYLQDAFGHPIRLDYGTGHESSFHVLLYCLCKLGVFNNNNNNNNNTINDNNSQQNNLPPPPSVSRLHAVTISLYHEYLKVTRILQTVYMLEPAGSHGVWGLDDYHCLPFYFGANQLISRNIDSDTKEYTPNSVNDDNILQSRDGDVYLYFTCIRYVKQLKGGGSSNNNDNKNNNKNRPKVPFFEHSPMLYDISQLESWQRVASGLYKLYQGEVLSKRQVVQHFVFGDIFKADWTPSQADVTRPPAETFRTAATTTSTMNKKNIHLQQQQQQPAIPLTRAPWATKNDMKANAMLPMTRAPWATNDSLDDNVSKSVESFPVTKAPWAANKHTQNK